MLYFEGGHTVPEGKKRELWPEQAQEMHFCQGTPVSCPLRLLPALLLQN